MGVRLFPRRGHSFPHTHTHPTHTSSPCSLSLPPQDRFESDANVQVYCEVDALEPAGPTFAVDLARAYLTNEVHILQGGVFTFHCGAGVPYDIVLTSYAGFLNCDVRDSADALAVVGRCEADGQDIVLDLSQPYLSLDGIAIPWLVGAKYFVATAGGTGQMFGRAGVPGVGGLCAEERYKLAVLVVPDTKAPVFVRCPGDVAVDALPGQRGANVSWLAPLAADNLDKALAVSQTQGRASGSFFAVGTTPQRFEVTDTSGNTAQCSFDVTVRDAEPPVWLACPGNVTLQTEPFALWAAAAWTPPVASDNVGVVAVSASHALGEPLSLGSTRVSYVAYDGAGGQTPPCVFFAHVAVATAVTVEVTPGTTVRPGSRLTFRALVQSDSVAAIAWYKNNAQLPGENGALLSIDRAETAAAASYFVAIRCGGRVGEKKKMAGVLMMW